MAYQYETCYPTSMKDVYTKSDIINFKFSVPATQKLKKGSLRLSGITRVLNGANVLADNTNIMINLVGIHAFIKNIITKTQVSGELENIIEYGRLVNMQMECRNTFNDMVANSDFNTELVAPEYEIYKGILRIGSVPSSQNGTIADAVNNWNSFSIRPRIVLNNSSDDIPGDKLGLVEIQISLTTEILAFFGAGVAANTKFEIKDLRLDYILIPNVEKKEAPVILSGYSMDEMQIVSSTTSLVLIQPVLARSVSVSFGQNLVMGRNNICSVPFQAADTTNILKQVTFNTNSVISPIEFILDNLEDVKMNYVKSMQGSITHNSVSDDNYGIGLDFGAPMDLSNNQLTVKIDLTQAPVAQLRALVFYNKLMQI